MEEVMQHVQYERGIGLERVEMDNKLSIREVKNNKTYRVDF
jgi:hypothetical protein